MRNIMITFDLEEFVTPAEIGMDINKEILFKLSLEGLTNIINLLKKHPKIKATFFTTWEFAQRAQEFLSSLISDGHELALHGLTHNINLSQMNLNDIKNELLTAKNNLERKFNVKINGFRSPQMKDIDPSVFKEIGITYNSSLHPTYIPGRSNNFFKRRNPYYDLVYNIPVSVTPLLRLPFSWIWFRNMGLFYSKICTKLSCIDQDFINIYFHPWDFVNINKEPFKGNVMGLILRNTGDSMISQFDKYLTWCENNFNSVTMSEYTIIKNGSK